MQELLKKLLKSVPLAFALYFFVVFPIFAASSNLSGTTSIPNQTFYGDFGVVSYDFVSGHFKDYVINREIFNDLVLTFPSSGQSDNIMSIAQPASHYFCGESSDNETWCGNAGAIINRPTDFSVRFLPNGTYTPNGVVSFRGQNFAISNYAYNSVDYTNYTKHQNSLSNLVDTFTNSLSSVIPVVKNLLVILIPYALGVFSLFFAIKFGRKTIKLYSDMGTWQDEKEKYDSIMAETDSLIAHTNAVDDVWATGKNPGEQEALNNYR